MSRSKFLGRLIGLSLTALSVAFGATSANAATVIFTDRTAFESAVLGLNTFDFNSSTLNLNLDAGVDFGAFTISQTTAGGSAYIRGPGTLGDVNGTRFVQFNDNSSGTVPLMINFDDPVHALGFDYHNADTNFDFHVYLNILGTDYLVASAGASGFFGFISTDTQSVFSFVDFPEAGSGTLGLDNLSWTTVAPVPIPGALLLMLSGLGFLGLTGARRKSQAS